MLRALVLTVLAPCAFAAIAIVNDTEVKLAGVTEVRSTLGTKSGGLALRLDISSRLLQRNRFALVTITSVVDDTGRALQQRPFETLGLNLDSSKPAGSSEQRYEFVFDPVARGATKLRELRGHVEILDPLADPEARIVAGPWERLLEHPLKSPALEKAGVAITVEREQALPGLFRVVIQRGFSVVESVHLLKDGREFKSSSLARYSAKKSPGETERIWAHIFDVAPEGAELVILLRTEKSMVRTEFAFKDVALP